MKTVSRVHSLLRWRKAKIMPHYSLRRGTSCQDPHLVEMHNSRSKDDNWEIPKETRDGSVRRSTKGGLDTLTGRLSW